MLEVAVQCYAPRGPVIEFGAYHTPEFAALSDLRPVFPGLEYSGCDIRPGPGVDRVGDAQAMDFADASVGTVIMLEILEHLPNPAAAVAESRRVLRDDGLYFVSVPFTYRLHGFPSDYVRYTASGLSRILAPFEARTVVAVGPRLKPAFCFAIAAPVASDDFVRRSMEFRRVAQDRFHQTRVRGFTSALKERARDFFGLLLGRAELGLQFFDPTQASPYGMKAAPTRDDEQ
jgi:SAM-dependent methyltransferase